MRRTIRFLTMALAWSLAASVLTSGAVAQDEPPPPPGCDANGDGDATGYDAWIVSDGDDDAAAELSEKAGLDLRPRSDGYRWRVPVCIEYVDDGDGSTDDEHMAVTGSATTVLADEAPRWQANALNEALDNLRDDIARPGPATSPHVRDLQYVGLETWLAVDPGAWINLFDQGDDGEVVVTVSAQPTASVWTFEDGVSIRCTTNVAYVEGAPGPAPCGREFTDTTNITNVDFRVHLEYTYQWTSTIGGSGSGVISGEDLGRFPLTVGEIQTFLTDGDVDVPDAGGDHPPIGSEFPRDDSNCGITDLGDCLGDVIEGLTDLALELVPDAVKDAAQMVLDFLEGCASYVGEVFSSVGEIISQLGQLITDPSGFISEKLDVARALYDGIQEDPAGFALEFLGDAVDYDLLQENPAEWAGKIGCEIAVSIITGGAAASGRFARIFDDVNAFMDDFRDWQRRRDDDNDGDGPDGPTCRASFPGGTEVVLADGSRQPIEQIREGTKVLSHDLDTGRWLARPVLHQWSYLDTDEMATAVLADGTAIIATDHHQFWVPNRMTWVELQDVNAADQFLTPAGAVAVSSIEISPSGPTEVWELTVAVEHNFLVAAGDNLLLVHNKCGNLPDNDGINSRLSDEGLDWVSADDVNGAWDRYEGDLSADEWLDRYVVIRRNAGQGNAYETARLGELGVDKNTEVFNVIDENGDAVPGFIPDGVRSDSPPDWVEVKDYAQSTLYPSSNAGAMVQELIRRARQGDDPGTFTLVMSNTDNLSDGMRDLFDQAEALDITINLVEVPRGG